MGTAITNRTEQSGTMLSYKAIFGMSGSLEARISLAVGRLLTVKRQDLDPSVQAWCEQLSGYEPDELTAAFNRAELEIRAFPDIADIVDFIEKPRFHDALALALRGIAKHGVEWQDIPGRRWIEEDRSVFRSRAEGGPPKVEKVEMPIPAPEMPARLKRTLELFGQTRELHWGLKRLKRDHPAFWTGDTEFETGQHGRQAAAIERDLYQCWLEAR